MIQMPSAAVAHSRDEEPRRHYRTVFLSDTHLGAKRCRARELLSFLQRTSCDTLYLVGDIIDGWKLRRRWYWPELHAQVLNELLERARKGTRVIYVPGNHDAVFRTYDGLVLGELSVEHETIHETADGRRMLVQHGDAFDGFVADSRWLGAVGDHAYEFSLFLNDAYNGVRKAFGRPYWSLSLFLKQRVKEAVGFLSRFEERVAEDALQRGVDGVICGHVHKAEMRDIGGVLYCNDGDWVESCTALVERADGSLQLVQWQEGQAVPIDGTQRYTAPAPELEPQAGPELVGV